MKNKKGTKFNKKLLTLLLSAVISLSMTFTTFAEPLASEGEAATDASSAVTEEAQEVTDAELDEDNPAVVQEELEEAAKSLEETDVEEPEAETSGSSLKIQKFREPEEEDTEEIPDVEVTATGGINFITATWEAVEGAEYFMVFLDDQANGVKIAANDSTPRKRMFSVKGGSHTVTVKAYRRRVEKNDTDPKIWKQNTDEDVPGEPEDPTENEDELLAEGSAEDINSVVRPMLGNGNRGILYCGAKGFGVDLRTILGEGHGGYAVAQGAATDGVHGYFLMVSNATQMGRIVKMRLSDRAVIKCGPIVDIDHGNGMTYDSKRGLLVINQRGSRKNKIVYVDPNTLKLKATKTLKYPYKFSGMPSSSAKAYTGGIAAIAYIEKFDVFLARSRGKNSSGSAGDNACLNDLWVYNAETLEAIGHITTKICADYPTLYQSMAADERYAYFLLSPGSRQPYNVILALDWNSEQLLPVMNGEKDYVERVWSCNDNGGGKPDGVIRIPIKHESEGLFLVRDENTGKSHFYVSEFYGRAHYKTVTKTKKVKKKWKKVRKWYNKKTKKWTTKKPKKKYRGKSKKVWKYKNKKKKYKAKVQDYWARSDYVYDLGTF